MQKNIHSKNSSQKEDIHTESCDVIENDVRYEDQEERMSVKNKIIFIISIVIIVVTQFYHFMKLIGVISK